jgi:transposase-like protein
MALERMKSCSNVTALAKELGVSRSALYKWKWQMQASEEGAGSPSGIAARTLRKKIHELERVLAEKTLEVDFFKGALQKIAARRQKSGKPGGTASTTKSES